MANNDQNTSASDQLYSEDINRKLMDSSSPGYKTVKAPKILKTIPIYLLLLIPLILGLKITLYSRDKYIREYFKDDTMLFKNASKVPDIIWGLTHSMLPIGAGIGALSISYISNILGRKYSVIGCAIVGISAQLILFSAFYSKKYLLLVLSRFLDGLSSGSSMNVGLCYFFDILPRSQVSKCQPLVQLFLNFGLVISCIFSLDEIIGKQWIFTSIPVTIVQGLLILILLCLSESPQYIYEKTTDRQKTLTILSRLRGKNYSGLKDELDMIINDAEKNANVQKISILAFLRDKSLAASIFVMSIIQLFQQFSGINAIIYYANTFMEQAKFNRGDIGSIVMISLCLAGSIFFTPFLTKYSAKLMLCMGYFGMSIFFFAAFLSWMLGANSYLLIFFLGAYLFVFQAGPGPQPWVIIMDTYSLEQRLAAQGFFTFLNWSANALVAIVYMWISGPLDFYVSLIFGSINLFTFFFLWIFMINATGKTHIELMREYQKKIPIFN
ncbi:hypothetical protein HZS_1102 [Henneguya salminicola]|nr:hypothetical protein HZS_1102 [Henneguya salminicola]